MMDRDRLHAYIQRTITSRANASSLLMCLKSVMRNDESAAVEYLHSICKMDPFLAVQTVTMPPENQMNTLIPVIRAWILDHASDTIGVKDLLAILGLKDRELFRITKDAMTADLVRRFFQDCPCSLGCRMMRYCYELEDEEFIGICEVALVQMLNRYDTEADEELGLLIPEIAKHKAKFLLFRLIEIMGPEQVSTLSGVSVDEPDPSYDRRSQFHENMIAASQLNDDELWEKVEESDAPMTDLLLCLYIDRFLSQPHTEEELLADGLWRAQMYADRERTVLSWFYLSVLEKLGEGHPLLKYINTLAETGEGDFFQVYYLERCKAAVMSLLDQPDRLSHWIDMMGEANPYSFQNDHMVSSAFHENEKTTLHDALKRYFDMRLDAALLVRLFLNTPMRCSIPLKTLLQMGKDYGRLDQLLAGIQPYLFFAKRKKRYLNREVARGIFPCDYVGEEPYFPELEKPKGNTWSVTYQIIGLDDDRVLAREFKGIAPLQEDNKADAGETADQPAAVPEKNAESSPAEAHDSGKKETQSALKAALDAKPDDDSWEKSLTLIKTAAALLNQLPSNAEEKDKTAIADEGCRIARKLDFLPDCFESQFDLDRMTRLLSANTDQFSYLEKILRAMKWNELFADDSGVVRTKYFIILKRYEYFAKWLFRDLFSKGFAEHTIISFYLQSIYKMVFPLNLLLSYGDRERLLTELKKWRLPVREKDSDERIFRLANIKCTSAYQVLTCDNWAHPAGFFAHCIDFENNGGRISNIVFQEEENSALINERKRKRQNSVFGHLAQKKEISEKERREIEELPPLDQYIWDDVALPLRCLDDAVSLRRNEPDKILEMLDLLGDRNPFSPQIDIRIELYYLQLIFRADQKRHFNNVMISIIMNAASGKDIMRIYLHTGLKYYVTLNTLWAEVHARRPLLAAQFEEALQVCFFPCMAVDGSVWCPYLEQNSFSIAEPSLSNACCKIGLQGAANGQMEIISTSRMTDQKKNTAYILLSCILLGYRHIGMSHMLSGAYSQFLVPLRPGKQADDPLCLDDLLSAIICADRDAEFITFYKRALRKTQLSRTNRPLPENAFSCQYKSPGSYVQFLKEKLYIYRYHQDVKIKLLDEISLHIRNGTISQTVLLTRIFPQIIKEYLALYHDRTIVDEAAERVRVFYGTRAADQFRESIDKKRIQKLTGRTPNAE